MNTVTKGGRYSIDVEATAEVHLDDFDDADIIAYCVENKLAIPTEVLDAKSEVERLYYATRGDGPLTATVADQVRALLRTLVGRV